MIPSEWIQQAVSRISDRVEVTPLTYDPDLCVFLKWENHQITGSFKLRGAMNKILSLESWEIERGLVTASAGNHGQGVALAASRIGAKVMVFASQHAVSSKLAAMRELGAEVHLVSGGYARAEEEAIQFSRDCGAVWISPYNDGQVIAGQATLAVETLDQLITIPHPPPTTWIVPAGGGGLVAGVGVVLKAQPSPIRLVAVQSEASAFLHALWTHNSQADVREEDSLADGLAGAVEEGSITVPMVKALVDQFLLVSEPDIANAIRYAWHRYGQIIEGSAAVALAAVLMNRVDDRPVLVILTGGNIEPEVHARMCAQGIERGAE